MVIGEVWGLGPGALTGMRAHVRRDRSGINERLAVLGDPGMTGIDRSSSDLLGVDWRLIAERLTTQLIRAIFMAAAVGGPLGALASQLNHDVTHLQHEQAAGVLAGLSAEVRSVLDAILDLRGLLASLHVAAVRPVRSAYLHQVRRIAPGELLDRRNELEELEQFCTGRHDRHICSGKRRHEPVRRR